MKYELGGQIMKEICWIKIKNIQLFKKTTIMKVKKQKVQKIVS